MQYTSSHKACGSCSGQGQNGQHIAAIQSAIWPEAGVLYSFARMKCRGVTPASTATLPVSMMIAKAERRDDLCYNLQN